MHGCAMSIPFWFGYGIHGGLEPGLWARGKTCLFAENSLANLKGLMSEGVHGFVGHKVGPEPGQGSVWHCEAFALSP